ncbi:hypothetical protein Tco_0087627 [Tanacetum coccineum]
MRDQAPHDSTTGPSSQPQDDTSEKVVHESSSTTDSERTESGTEATAPKVDKEQGEVTSTTVTSGVGISVRTENQAGSDPGQGHKALAGSNLEPMQEDSGPGKEHVALAGPNPEHMDEDFYATALTQNQSSWSKHHNNTEATTITTAILEITPFIALQLRVAKLEQDINTCADALESSKKQESEKSPKEIIRIKREQGEKKPEPTYTIKSTDKVALEEFDLKGALFNIMHKNKPQRSVISDDDEDDDDDRTLQLDQTKRVRRKGRRKRFKCLCTTTSSSPLMEALIEDENAMDKEVADKDTDNAHIPKVPAATWFKPIPEEERPATPEPEWTIPSNDYPEPENNWANVYATTYQDPKENKLQRKTGDIGSFIKWFCK